MSEETQQPAAKVDDMMLSSERREEIDRFALGLAFKSQCGDEVLTEEEDMIVDLSRHLAGLEQKMQNLSTQFRLRQNAIDLAEKREERLDKFAAGLAQGIKVAKSGILVGEIAAMEAILGDLTSAMEV